MSKILVVEDSKTQREMIISLLLNNQFEVMTAKNGVEAIGDINKGQMPISASLSIQKNW